MITTIRAGRLFTGTEVIEHPLLTIEHGRIASIQDGVPAAGGARSYEFPEALLVPAFVNIHVHGASGFDVMEGTPEALHTVGRTLARNGTGAFYPTTVTSSLDETLRALEMIAGVMASEMPGDSAVPLGIHLEGPFLSAAKRGVHPAAKLVAPSVELFDRFWQAAQQQIRILTIAPELPGALELIQHATGLGVICSLGHSNATLAEADAGFRCGARSATHTFNAMRALDHRDPGIAAYVLDNDGLFAELICDGIHVDPAMVRLFFKAKGMEKSILVTDGMAATGMPDGRYKLGDLDVEVSQGRCTSAGSPGVLAGSVLAMDQAVRNFSAFTGVGLEVSARLAGRNPATLMGLAEGWGSLQPGQAANLVALSATGQTLQSFRAGLPLLD